MRSQAVAIAWQLFAPYRLWFIGALAYLILVIVCCQAMPKDPALMIYRLDLAIPLIGIPIGLMVIFVFGGDIDVAGKDSAFPSRMFTLPMRTPMLVVWPMLYGTLAMAAVCVIITEFVFRPSGISIPHYWPPLLAATCLAWLQVVVWSPLPLAWLRLPVLALLIGIQAVLIPMCYIYQLSETCIVYALAGQLLVACGLAVMAVSRARRGSNPNWRWFAIDLLKPLRWAMARRRPFKTASQAQFWLEWRMHGNFFLFAALLTTPLFVTFLIVNQLNPEPPEGFFLFSLMQLFLFLTLLGFFLNINSHWGKFISARREREPSSFLAIRPMSSATMVAVKLKAAAKSVILTYGLAVIIASAMLFYKGYITESGLRLTMITRSSSPFYGIAFACAIMVLTMAGTWRLAVENIFVPLMGRRWLTVFFGFAIYPAYLFIPSIIFHHVAKQEGIQWQITLVYALWILAAIKIFLACGIFTVLRRRRLYAWNNIALASVIWLFCAGCVCGIFCWMKLITSGFTLWYVFASLAIIAVPLVRIAFGPLALAWNRHR
ncbi:MAG: hypothetical protein ABSA26_17935 [Thermoguttaceae bacterium]|jgi:hypothetical protein